MMTGILMPTSGEIISNGYSAEYGASAGGVVVSARHHGTNELHGSVFEFFRNKVLDANSWTRNSSTQKFQYSQPAPLSWNQPGFSLGGPFVIPKVFNTDRKKLFFFFAKY
jgi:hypothetical protein